MIKSLPLNEISLVSELAYRIWPVAYKKMLSNEQITYMLQWMYDIKKLQEDYRSGDVFYAYFMKNEAIGFVHLHHNKEILKLQKIYLLPEYHHLGIGSTLIKFCKDYAKKNQFKVIELQVNRENPAVHFYLKNGFVISHEADFAIGNGFFMNDFIMQLKIFA